MLLNPPSTDPVNNFFKYLFALSRSRFQTIDISRYVCDGPVKTLYGYHSFSTGLIANDIEKLNGQKLPPVKVLGNPETKPITIYYQESVSNGGQSSFMSNNLQKGTQVIMDEENSKVIKGDCYLLEYVNYPVFFERAAIYKMAFNTGVGYLCAVTTESEHMEKKGVLYILIILYYTKSI